MILCNSDDQKVKESRYLEVLEEHRVQGILITPVSGADKRLASVRARDRPGGADHPARPRLTVMGIEKILPT